MYSHNRIGTWHRVDLSASKYIQDVENIDDGLEVTDIDSAIIKPYLQNDNLGSKEDCFKSATIVGGNFSLPGNKRLAYGVALRPLDTFTVSKNPVFIEVNIALTTSMREHIGKLAISGFVGHADSVNAGPCNSTFVNIPTQRSDSGGIYIKEQILVQPITTGQIDVSKYIIVGFYIMNGNSFNSQIGDIDYSIAARYARQKIITQDMTR